MNNTFEVVITFGVKNLANDCDETLGEVMRGTFDPAYLYDVLQYAKKIELREVSAQTQENPSPVRTML